MDHPKNQWILDQMRSEGPIVHLVYFEKGIEWMLHVVTGQHLATCDLHKVTCKKCLFTLTFPGLADYVHIKLQHAKKTENNPHCGLLT